MLSDLTSKLFILDHRELIILMVASWADIVATHRVT